MKRFLFLSSITGLIVTNLSALPKTGLTAHWSFESGLSNSTAASGNVSPSDSSNLNLSAVNGITYESNDLLGDMAVRLNGADSYLKIQKSATSQDKEVVPDTPLPDTTISVWFKADQAPTGSERFTIYETSPNSTLSLDLREGATTENTQIQTFTKFADGSSVGCAVQFPDELLAGQWVHALVSLSPAASDGFLRLKINGDGSQAETSFDRGSRTMDSFNDFHIGTYRNADENFFPGLIDEFAVWNRLLTPEESAEIYCIPSIVLNLNDSGPGSLRDAVACAAPGEIITFAPSLSGKKITLTSGQISIEKDLDIDAFALPGGITIDANFKSRILQFNSVTTNFLRGLTLINGDADFGGGIFKDSEGSLILSQCTLSGNSAIFFGGGLYNRLGTLMVGNSTFSANSTGSSGGGIFCESCPLTIENSTLSSNSASIGGGIFCLDETLTIRNSTFAGNTATIGGGLTCLGDTLTVKNSTLSGNSAISSGGGVYCDAPSLTVESSTLSGNSANLSGGGIRSKRGVLTMKNSVVAGNNALADANLHNEGTLTGTNNLLSGDPQLAPLGDYGGPTQTMPPLPGSPVINAAGSTALTIDQRGLSRIIGVSADIGAVEYQECSDLALFWPSDWDGDGIAFGIEHALGTDPISYDPQTSFDVLPAGDNPEISFDRNPRADPKAIWIVSRSPNLAPASFTEVFRLADGTQTLNPNFSIRISGDTITLIDDNPPEEQAFYRFEAHLAPVD